MNKEELINNILDSFQDDEYFSDKSEYINDNLETFLNNLDYIQEKSPDAYDLFVYIQAKAGNSINDRDFQKYILKPLEERQIIKLEKTELPSEIHSINASDATHFMGKFRANLNEYKVTLP